MKVTIAYDNKACEGFSPAWGFSAIIETADRTVLFDSGWDGELLLSNMGKLGFDPAGIDAVAISHHHWDHIGGLPTVLSRAPDAEVFVCSSLSPKLAEEIGRTHSVRSVSGPQKIAEGIMSLGEVETSYKGAPLFEQSLELDAAMGRVMLVGCSHPGLGRILEMAGGASGVIGGFHGFDRYEELQGLELIVPTHCTQNRDKIMQLYPDACEAGGAGWSKEL